jgi:ABC-type sugar transport system ATPase subunit
MIHLDHVTVRVGSFRLERISLRVPAGGYAVLMGRTGSGKTTLLECLCGLRTAESGKIILEGKDVTHRRPAERGIGYVPQDGALFTTMTVRQHLGFPLLIRKWRRKAMEQRTDELAQLLSIENLLDRRPQGLSGGESQRVALGRALAFQPSVLVLDEPLSALDDQTREQMYGLLKHVQRHAGITALHVTHSRMEAQRLADQLFILEDGSIRPMDPAITDLESMVRGESSWS